jgi:dihydroflavonol-4-reductase
LPETALVTGATGFIGAALCRALLAQGLRVRAFHRPTSPLDLLAGLPVEHAVGDILQPSTLTAACAGAGWVFHTATEAAYWRRPQDVLRTAVEGTRHVVRAARQAGAQRLLLTSSLAALGTPAPGKLLDETHEFNLPPHRFPYGYAKQQAERAALDEAGSALEVVIVNPTVVLGAGDLHQISGSLITEAARGRAVVWMDGGWNVVHIDDVADGHLAAMRHGRPGERYLLGAENLTHRETLRLVTSIVGRPAPRLRLPGWSIPLLASLIDAVRLVARLPFDGNQLRLSRHFLYCDSSKARLELGWLPRRTFRQAAQETFDWYRARGVI